MTELEIQAWLDQEDAHTTEMIRRHGWIIEYVGGSFVADADGSYPAYTDDDEDPGGPSFGYTVGLFGLHHPELLIVGVPPETAEGVLNDLGGRIRSGEALLPGSVIAFDAWPHRVVPEKVPNPGEIVLAANRYYDRPPQFSVPALQLSYDDRAGRFPWEPGYAAPAMQPRPGRWRAWG